MKHLRFSVCFLLLVFLAGAAGRAAQPLNPADLPELLGKPVEDPKIQQLIKSLGSLTIRQRGKLTLYKFFDDGIQLVINNKGVIEGISLHGEGAYNFKQYKGELPYGINFNDSRTTILEKLGKPDEETVTIDKHRVDVFARYRMAISYVSGDDKKNGMKIFTVYMRKDY